ncbi:hypothetical protein Poli38472_010167 [Pythium oligandrum]|uniref:Uncharacterized protein n=1 Tax=Pythium oligandrum TaxID=41045 RepID=A0A8K1C8Z4_PYTOL|nr:hypothetical protein Poli38472_010167 [Pythium oligandrum]|eukprot:TMW58608.1 hypothetical protein Poli38472_010167 [Pythium oligandrum]
MVLMRSVSTLRALRTPLQPAAVQACAFSTNKRTYPSFTKYGTESAFQAQPVAPVYASVPGREYLKTKRSGSVMLSWAHAAENSKSKSYSYNDKVFFSLSPTEVGLVLEVLDAKLAEVTLTHSPNMNSKDAAEKARRSLLDIKRVTGPDGHPNTEINVVTTNSSHAEVEEKVSLNAGETRVLKELLIYSLPRLYGFNLALEGSPIVEGAGNGGSDNWNQGGRGKNSQNTSGGAAPEWPF